MREIDKWQASLSDRRMVEKFWDWLTEQHGSATPLREIDIFAELDRFHGIDRQKLDGELRRMADLVRPVAQKGR